ncbi:MAG: elongation factor G, partial [Candidatus Liptonbacteria bacterium]|nr:elongation factor G [Candidatus Liptonbacteria bacterium]
EPIMAIQVIAPAEFLGDVTGDMSAKRGAIEAMNDRGQVKVIDAKVPLSEMFGYATKLRSMTQGRGSFTMQADHYEEVPASIAQLIVEGKK